MEAITLNEVVKAVGGKLLGPCTDGTIKITGVTSDNRTVKNGDLFAAFIGEKVDGHRFADAALEAGACGVLVSKDPEHYMPGKFYVLVEDTIRAVGDLAAYYRSLFDIPVVGVTGSVGKTTTKDMIAAVLSRKFNVLKTQANFNNHIGLPRTIFNIDHTTQIAVIEMGMNHTGEIDHLTNIAKPTVVTITNVGEAHIGNLGSRENIFRAKAEIFNGLKEGGLAVMNGDDEYLPKLRRDTDKNDKYSFAWIGEGFDNDYRAEDINDTLSEKVTFTAVTPQGSFDVEVPALGRHMIYPALTAAAVGAHFGMTNDEIAEGTAGYVPTALRMEKLTAGDNILIYNDTYNANPQSMKAGLLTLSNAKGYNRIAVLGDMFELGEMQEQLHREVGAYAARLGIDTLITVGRASLDMADEAAKNGLKDVRAVLTREEALEEIGKVMKKDTAFLFKASHGMELGKLAEAAVKMAQDR